MTQEEKIRLLERIIWLQDENARLKVKIEELKRYEEIMEAGKRIKDNSLYNDWRNQYKSETVISYPGEGKVSNSNTNNQ